MKFLVAYNGTKEAEAALEVAQSHARIFDAKLVVVSSSEGGKGEKIEDINVITGFGVMMTPALAIDGEVKAVGKVLSSGDIQKLLA